MCNVDSLVLRNGRIRIIVEIEESDVKPTRICGKLLTAAIATCHIHKNAGADPILKDDAVMFLQVLSTLKLKDKSKKREQWKNIEKHLQHLLPLGQITAYRIFCGVPSEFATSGQFHDEVVSLVRGACA